MGCDPRRERLRLGVGVVELGVLLGAERERAGLSVRQVAGLAGVSASTVVRVEQGGGDPSLGTVAALCRAYGVPLSQLLVAAGY